jgi:hypothetical protein
MGENGEDFDFGTAAMRMLEGIRRNDEDDPRNQRIEEVEEPDSPTPQGSGGGMVLTAEPKSGDFGHSSEVRSHEDRLKMGRRSTSSSRRAYPDQVVEEEVKDEAQDEKSEELEYVDVDQLKEEE